MLVFHLLPICCLLRMMSFASSDDCGTMRCMEPHAPSVWLLYKGSGCMNSTPNEDDSVDDVGTDELSYLKI